MKKRIFLFSLLVFSTILFAQAPQGINYQGVARDPSGSAIPNSNISIEFKIWQGNPTAGGSIIYSEIHNPVQTDTFGLYTAVIGSKSGSGTGTFSSISWSAGNMWVEVYIDPAGGTAFNLVLSQQLMSVPYALYAETAGSGSGSANISGKPNSITKMNVTGNGLKSSIMYESSDSSSIGINTTNPRPGAVLDIGSTTKGLLIPRMTSTQRSAIPSVNLHHGLTVFQTNNVSILNPEGYWYYDSIVSNWLLMAPAQAVWTLSGNAPGTSGFIGTLDGNDMVFKTGFISANERMRIVNSTGQVSFGNLGAGTHFIFPATKGNPGDILQLDPAGTNNLQWKSTTSTSSWSRSGGNVFLTNSSDSVGIGTSTPRTSLEVVSTNTRGAMNVTNNNTAGGGGVFSVSNPSNDSSALVAYTKGGGQAFLAVTEGTANAGAFGVLNSSSIASGVLASTNGSGKAVFGLNTGMGYGGLFMINNVANDSAAIAGMTTGKGPAILGYNPGMGSAGIFQVTNANNVKDVITSLSNGLGSAGSFQVSNSSNSSAVLNLATNGTGMGLNINSLSGTAVGAFNSGGGPTIDATNSGGGGNAGNFKINNNANGNAALQATTTGGGNSIQGDNAAGGSAIFGNHTGAGIAVKGVNSGTGIAGSFNVTSATSTSDALVVTTASSNAFSGNFSGGGGLRTDKIRISGTSPQPGLFLSATNTNGDAAWTPLPGMTNFGVSVSSTAQSMSASATVTVNLGTPGYSNGGVVFSGSGNLFNAPSNGIYHFDTQITINNGNATSGGIVTLTLFDGSSGSAFKQVQYLIPNGVAASGYTVALILDTDIPLLSGQKVGISLSNNSTGTNYNIVANPLLSWFTGHKVN